MAKKKAAETSNRMAIQRPDQDTGKSAAVVFAIAGAVIGTLLWRRRKAPPSDTAGASTSQPKGKASSSKTAGSRRVKKKAKGKKRKAEEKPAEPSKKEKPGNDSVMYTNHRFFANPNGAATPIAAPIMQPIEKKKS